MTAALFPTSGCSWIFVQPLPEDHERRDYVACTTNRAAPVIDTLFTLTNVGSAIYVGTENNVANKGTAITVGLLVATIWALSASYGYVHTSECEEAMERGGRSYHPLPHLRPRPQYYPQPPQPRPPPPPNDAPTAAPAVPPAAGGSAPQRQDADEPQAHPYENLETPPAAEQAPPAPRPKKPPERLDAPRYGN